MPIPLIFDLDRQIIVINVRVEGQMGFLTSETFLRVRFAIDRLRHWLNGVLLIFYPIDLICNSDISLINFGINSQLNIENFGYYYSVENSIEFIIHVHSLMIINIFLVQFPLLHVYNVKSW